MGPGLRREDEQRVVGTSEAVIATRNAPPASAGLVSAKSAAAADAAFPRCTNLAAVIGKSPCCLSSRPYSDFTDLWQTARRPARSQRLVPAVGVVPKRRCSRRDRRRSLG